MMKKALVLGFFVTILLLHTCISQQFIDDKNDVLEWYYNLNQQNYNLNFPREKRQSSRFDNDDDDEWYVFDEVEPQPQPRTPNNNGNQFGWIPRQTQQQPGSFGQFRPNAIPSTSPAPQIPNAGPPRPSRCMENCSARTTSEYNPVCGTDGETYDNLAKMICAVRCGTTVQVRREGRCAPLLPSPPR